MKKNFFWNLLILAGLGYLSIFASNFFYKSEDSQKLKKNESAQGTRYQAIINQKFEGVTRRDYSDTRLTGTLRIKKMLPAIFRTYRSRSFFKEGWLYEKIEIEFHDQNGETYTMKADRGESDPEGKEIILNNFKKPLRLKSNKGIEISAWLALYKPEDQILILSKKVIVTQRTAQGRTRKKKLNFLRLQIQ